MTKKTFNHAFDIAFSVQTNNTAGSVTAPEMIAALEARLLELKADPDLILEACGMPFDTYILD